MRSTNYSRKKSVSKKSFKKTGRKSLRRGRKSLRRRVKKSLRRRVKKSLRRRARKSLRGGSESVKCEDRTIDGSQACEACTDCEWSEDNCDLKGGLNHFENCPQYTRTTVLKKFVPGQGSTEGDVVNAEQDEIAVNTDEVVQVIISYPDGWTLVKKINNTIGIVPTNFLNFKQPEMPTLINSTTTTTTTRRNTPLGKGGVGNKMTINL